jgi:hypothetical protein
LEEVRFESASSAIALTIDMDAQRCRMAKIRFVRGKKYEKYGRSKAQAETEYRLEAHKHVLLNQHNRQIVAKS